MNAPSSELGWAITRVVFGASLALFHGYAKVFEGGAQKLAGGVAELGLPLPHVFAWAASIAEFFGGLLVALGLLTRPAAAMCAVTMIVALYRHRADPFAYSELALLYLAVMVMALLVGGGRFSLDRFLGLRNPFGRRTPTLLR